MNFFLYLWYFLRSLALRGPLNSMLLLRDEARYEKKFGINTAGIKKSGSGEFFHYQGAPYRVLVRVLKIAQELSGDIRLIDIGCGRGRALFVAEHCGYNHLTGIELDIELLRQAETNLLHYHLKRPGSQFLFTHANALDYDYMSPTAVYFLFNPFNERVLEKVLGRILAASDAETWFVYMNPLYRKPFEKQGLEIKCVLKSLWYTEAVIYRRPALQRS